MRFLYIFSLLSSIFCLSGCLCVPAGDPPKGQIVNFNFSGESLTEEQAVEAMITKLTGAIVKNNISEKKIPVKFDCSDKIEQMSKQVLSETGEMLNYSIYPFAKNKLPRLYFHCTQSNKDKQLLWQIACWQYGKRLFETFVKIKK